MTAIASHEHLSLDDLLAYWLRETSPAATDAADEHLMGCERCGEALDGLIALGQGIRAAVRAGEVSAVVSPAFVQRAATLGLQVREYRLAHNGSVHCTVAPGDDLLVARLVAPLEGVERLDAVAEVSTLPGKRFRIEDVPFDSVAGEVLWMPRLTQVRAMPAHTLRVTLVAPAPSGDRPVGTYLFRHQPWAAPQDA